MKERIPLDKIPVVLLAERNQVLVEAEFNFSDGREIYYLVGRSLKSNHVFAASKSRYSEKTLPHHYCEKDDVITFPTKDLVSITRVK